MFDKRVKTFVNVGGNTEPDTFTFRNNAWFDIDNPERGPSGLPVAESGSVVRVDPQFAEPESFDFTVQSTDPRLKGIGAGRVPISGAIAQSGRGFLCRAIRPRAIP